MQETASSARQHERLRARPKAGMTGWVGRAILVAMLLASAGYLAFGGHFQASAAPAPESPVALLAARAAESGDAGRAGHPPIENLVSRCDRAAVAEANRAHAGWDHASGWRRERQLAFRSCVDASH